MLRYQLELSRMPTINVGILTETSGLFGVLNIIQQ